MFRLVLGDDEPSFRISLRSLAIVVLAVSSCDADGGAAGPGRSQRITYATDVAPLLRDRCGACHHPEGVGPFSLLTFQDAVGHADAIEAATAARRMPPWPADRSPSPSRRIPSPGPSNSSRDDRGRCIT